MYQYNNKHIYIDGYKRKYIERQIDEYKERKIDR